MTTSASSAGLRAGGAGELLAVVDDNLEVGGNQLQHFAGLVSDADLVRPAHRADAQRGLDRHLDAPPRQVRRRPLAFRRALGFGSLLGYHSIRIVIISLIYLLYCQKSGI